MKKLVAILLLLAVLCGCQGRVPQTKETVFAMDTVMTLQIWGADGETAAGEIKKMLSDLESTWSAHDENSFLARFNRAEATPNARQQAVLDLALQYSEETGGDFNPCLYSLMKLWGFPDKNYRVPTDEEIAAAKKEQQWDLGGILKGYAGDRAVEILADMQIDRAILNLGGNVQTYGQKEDGSPWKIAIENPKGGSPIGYLAVEGTMAVVTSGDYQRYFEVDGKRYHHILAPKTGHPAQSGLASVTVICKDGARADALSTAMFVMGLEQGSAYWRAHGDFEAVFVTKDGSIYATRGANFFGAEYEVIQ